MLTEQTKDWKTEKFVKRARSKEDRERRRAEKKIQRRLLDLKTRWGKNNLLQLLIVVMQTETITICEAANAEIEVTNHNLSQAHRQSPTCRTAEAQHHCRVG